MKILSFPLTKVFIGFLCGIMLSQLIDFGNDVVLALFSICFLGLSITFYYSQKHHSIKMGFGIFVFLASFWVGISTTIIHKENRNPKHFTNQITDYEKLHQLDLTLIEKLKSTSGKSRFTCRVNLLDGHLSLGKVILVVPKGQAIDRFKIGSHLWAIGTIYRNKNPLNPNLFDYGNYLENQEIYAQIYAKQIRLGKAESGLQSGFANFRKRIVSNLERSEISKGELNIINALILGQQQDIAPEVLKDYQYAGAVHILSVSGLHVGFILLFITYLLKPIGNSRKASLIKLCIIVLSIWAFALLSGLSASIVRSAAMFSFVAVGTHLRRTVNIYHTLIVSMLLILLFKPSFLFDVGFQLSYLSLFFIIWLQPLFSNIWQPKNKIIKYFWEIITVSFAAQIGAMPLSIYYFHQFPGLFFVTNLLILPLLGIIMGVGVVAIVIAIFQPLPFFIAKSIEFLINLLNAIIHQVASFDAFVIRNISFSKEMLLGSYLSIALIVLWMEKPVFKRLVFALASILILQGIFIYQKKETLRQSELVVFNSRKSTIITERLGNRITVYSNDSILKNLDDNLLVQSYAVGNFCQIKTKKRLQNLLYFKSQKVLVIDSSCIYSEKVKPDILVIIQSPKLNIKRLLRTFRPKQVVVDGSNYKSYIRLWEATCRKEKIPFHNTNEKGFYKI
ncbi:MAG: ComEC/Rec2 family competence protein [Flavobacterium sp.]